MHLFSSGGKSRFAYLFSARLDIPTSVSNSADDTGDFAASDVCDNATSFHSSPHCLIINIVALRPECWVLYFVGRCESLRIPGATYSSAFLAALYCTPRLLDKNGTARTDEAELCLALFLGPSIMGRQRRKEGFLLLLLPLLLPQEYNGMVAVTIFKDTKYFLKNPHF